MDNKVSQENRTQESSSLGKTMYKFMRIQEVSEATGFSRAMIYNLIREGRFPEQIRLTPSKVAWRSDEIQAWMDAKSAERACERT